ncbi:6-phosphogluconate dehydrogenase NAD-binding protein [Thermoproteus uzoniensis 768-20]|uniref:6-phosphogluconate dehydrogenase NAD-binding protein n=1 Tax=Thermoproteus uzoniensis (strain 768-20) TaxID=999630 RepID=F2L605_THEU7|nr:NAD(P)-binding domain-containing protein [Thermoproteus uzoniensis]AEA12450.1 6-phosphogluconate dehydrogenase NAD-binding protein [Thermoproteus uzoniensis 768-20]
MRVSVVGLGRMGRGIARNLARKGHEVRGYDVSEEAVKAASVAPCELPKCFEADYVVLALPTGKEVLEVLRSAPATDAVVVDTTTQSLSELRSVLEAARGLKYLTCRVERGPKDAEEGRLVLYVGGPRDLFEKASGFLSQLGEPLYVGTHEQATVLKLVSTALLVANTAALAEAAEILRRFGFDQEAAVSLLSKGGAASAQLNARMPAMLRGQFSVGFSAQQAEAVLRQLQELAEELGVEVLPVMGKVRELLRAAAAAGIGGDDIAELVLYVRSLNVQNPHSPRR